MITYQRDNDEFEQASADVAETHNVLLYLLRIKHAKFSTRKPNEITAWIPSTTGYHIATVKVGH